MKRFLTFPMFPDFVKNEEKASPQDMLNNVKHSPFRLKGNAVWCVKCFAGVLNKCEAGHVMSQFLPAQRMFV